MGKLIRNGIEYGGGNGTDIFEVTQAEYDALVQAGTLVHNALYVITDAPNLNETAEDISYDGSTTTVKDKIQAIETVAGGTLSIPTGVTATLNRGWAKKQGKIVVITASLAFSGSVSSGTAIITLPDGFSANGFVDVTGHDGNSNVVRLYISSGYVYAYQTIPSSTNIYFNATYVAN